MNRSHVTSFKERHTGLYHCENFPVLEEYECPGGNARRVRHPATRPWKTSQASRSAEFGGIQRETLRRDVRTFGGFVREWNVHQGYYDSGSQILEGPTWVLMYHATRPAGMTSLILATADIFFPDTSWYTYTLPLDRNFTHTSCDRNCHVTEHSLCGRHSCKTIYLSCPTGLDFAST